MQKQIDALKTLMKHTYSDTEYEDTKTKPHEVVEAELELMSYFLREQEKALQDEEYDVPNKIYVGGSLFTEAETSQRIEEGSYLRNRLQWYVRNAGEIVFNPIEQPFNDKTTLPTAKNISHGDYTAMKQSSHILFNLDNPVDAGVFMELGEMLESGHAKIYCVISDSRFENAGQYDNFEVPVGFNQYVIGRLQENGIKIYKTSKEAMDELINDYIDHHLINNP